MSETCAYPNDTDGEHDHTACVDVIIEENADLVVLETIDRLIARALPLIGASDAAALLAAARSEAQAVMASRVKSLDLSDAIAFTARKRVAGHVLAIAAAREADMQARSRG